MKWSGAWKCKDGQALGPLVFSSSCVMDHLSKSTTFKKFCSSIQIYCIRSLNITSLESQAMIKIIKAFLEKEGWLAIDDSDSDLSLPSSPTIILSAAVESRKVAAQNVKEAFKAIHGCEWEKEESEAVPSSVSDPQIANEAEAEIPTASLTYAVVIHEAEAEASNKDKGKGIMTEEEKEKRIEKEKREKEKRRREREEEEMAKYSRKQSYHSPQGTTYHVAC
ncbi:hypothetical protein L1987_37706 [Smallanthus sonchifolius]|uniref:Uncharacterized protein n=1 Tax=Smallanthus sonchifolius TaxID=185202 RepID=A0ACB9HHI5_9ASTR|nr:hypothetical protein L1987_37706 [Smallanthus sonchifolius]